MRPMCKEPKHIEESNLVIETESLPAWKLLIIPMAYAVAPISHVTTNNNTLVRPNIRYVRIVGLGLTYSALIPAALFTFLETIINMSSPTFLYVPLYYMILLYFFRKRIVIFFIHLYQARAPDAVRLRCPLVPSCSNYMIMAIDKYGLISGVLKGVARMQICFPPTREDYP